MLRLHSLGEGCHGFYRAFNVDPARPTCSNGATSSQARAAGTSVAATRPCLTDLDTTTQLQLRSPGVHQRLFGADMVRVQKGACTAAHPDGRGLRRRSLAWAYVV
jgi:hypothetical protein